MRQIASTLDTAFKQAYNVRPIVFLKVDWGDNVKIYSTQEVESDLGYVYPYVKEFSNLDSLTREDGFGSTTNLTVTFFDQNGHFKERFDTRNLFNVSCKIYLGSFGSTEYMLLFEGKFVSPISYDPDAHTFTASINSEDRNAQLCYTPSIDDVDESDTNYSRYEQLFTSSTWPEIFGTVAKFELNPLVSDLEFEVDEDLIAQTGVGAYTLKLRGDLLSTLPAGSYTFNIVGSDRTEYNLLVTAYFNGSTLTFANADITNHWYSDKFPITCETLDTTDSDGLVRKMRVRMTGIAEPPWLVGMIVKGSATFAFGSTTTAEYHPRLRVIDQVKYNPSDTYETVLVFPSSSIFPVQSLEYAALSIAKPHTIKEGTKVILHNWDKRGIYVIDNKESSPSVNLYFNNGEGYKKFPSFTYEIKSTDGNDSNKLWTGAIDPHPACTYVKFDPEVFGRMIITEKNISKGEGGQKLDTRVVGDISTSYDTDEKAIENILSRYTSLGFIGINPKTNHFVLDNEEDLTTIIPEIAWQKTKALRETVDGNQFKLELIDLQNLGDPVFNFNADNIHSEPISLYFTAKEDIKTVFKVTIKNNDQTKDLVKMIKKSNTELYGKTEPFTIDYYTYDTLTEARDNVNFWIDKLSTPYLEAEFTGYLDAITLEVWDVVYVDLGTINFYDPSRGLPYTNSTALYDNEVVVQGNAVIREMNINIQTGLIRFKVQFLDKTIGNTV